MAKHRINDNDLEELSFKNLMESLGLPRYSCSLSAIDLAIEKVKVLNRHIDNLKKQVADK